jgi:gluconokinase
VASPTVPIVLVTGVSGSGKTTVGALLARTLNWTYAEADGFHPATNVAKMKAGQPLEDADRWPWLRAIAAWIDEQAAAGLPAVVTCSGLKRSYRDVLRAGRPHVRLVYLDAGRDVIAARLAVRRGHFFPAGLTSSQFADLEPPGPAEHALTVSADAAPRDLVGEIITGLGLTPPARA